MTEPGPRRHLLLVRYALTAGAACLLARGGFAAGRLTAPGSDSGTATCEDARTTLHDAVHEAQSYQDDQSDQARQSAVVASNVVVQNPQCFDAKTRATVQVLLDGAE